MDFIKKIIENRISKALKNDNNFSEMKEYLLNEFNRIGSEYGSAPVAIVRKAEGNQIKIDIVLLKPLTLPDNRKVVEIKIIESITLKI